MDFQRDEKGRCERIETLLREAILKLKFKSRYVLTFLLSKINFAKIWWNLVSLKDFCVPLLTDK